jgi:hypothetical protein
MWLKIHYDVFSRPLSKCSVVVNNSYFRCPGKFTTSFEASEQKKEIPYRIHTFLLYKFIVLLISCGKYKVLPLYLVPLPLLAAATAEELYAQYSSPNYLGN